MNQSLSLEEVRVELLDKLEKEEETENNLIWIYDTLISLGVEKCFSPSIGEKIKSGMKILADESREHRLLVERIKSKYKN